MQLRMDAKAFSWELWRTFDGVMREGSLSAAARTLGLTQPTAGRHIAELEAALSTGGCCQSNANRSPHDAFRSLSATA